MIHCFDAAGGCIGLMSTNLDGYSQEYVQDLIERIRISYKAAYVALTGTDWLAETCYYDTVEGKAKLRLANTAVLTGSTLTQVPVPATVKVGVKGSDAVTEYATNEATVELGFTYAGTYTVTVSAFPYLDAEFEVTV